MPFETYQFKRKCGHISPIHKNHINDFKRLAAFMVATNCSVCNCEKQYK